MRILYIVTAFPRSPGDIITPWLTETINRLRARGVDVEVLAPSYRGLGDQRLEGTEVHRFRYAPAAFETLTHDQTTPDRLRESPAYGLLLPGYLAAGSLRAIRLARSRRFDAIHCFWPLPHGLFGLAARTASGVPVISTFFGVELTWVRRQLRLLAPLVRWIIRRSDAVTVISSHTAREVDRLALGVASVTIPFGAAVSTRSPEASPEAGAEPRPSSEFRLLFVGRLVERKGVSILLRALATVRGEGDVRLTVVGDGPLRTALEAETSELGIDAAVEFTGFIPSGELGKEFARCDAFVLPAIEDSKGDVEGLGVVLIEAILHDRPVIASQSGGIPDIVVDGRSGLLTQPGDVDSLADAIRRMRADSELRERLRRGGRDHVEQHFSWDRIIDRLESLYRDVADRKTDRSTTRVRPE